MKITVIGWYGTETIGDRAILLGIIAELNDVYPNFELNLGSLYPFFTERSLSEDYDLIKEFIGRDINITMFNSRNTKELDVAVKNCDMLVMGGGPLMHIHTLFMVEYAFKMAKKWKKKSMIFGCGVGPIHKKMHQKSMLKIFDYASAIVLRDSLSFETYQNLRQKFKHKGKKQIGIALDPAVRCLLDFKERSYMAEKEEPYIAVNYRRFPGEYADKELGPKVHNKLVKHLEKIANDQPETEILLVPMHYFHIGNDDRAYLNEFVLNSELKNVEVQNEVLSLFKTMLNFNFAKVNIGMRFHSVVFQTILAGNNFVLDYTEPKIGKIAGFLTDINAWDFYKNRYLNLQESGQELAFDNKDKTFEVDKQLLSSKLSIYNETLQSLN